MANQGNSSGNRRRPQSESAYAAASRQRKPQQVARRHPPEIYRRRRVAAIAIVVFLLVLVVFLAGACGPGPTRSLQGDQLGPDPEESAEQYQTRAAESVEDARRETYALVTFDPPVNAQTAAQAVDAAERVNAVIAQDDFRPIELPEPTDGETRVDVLTRAIAKEKINSVIIYEDGKTLEEIAQGADIFAVEAAPHDAAWGGFGIRPLISEQAGQR